MAFVMAARFRTAGRAQAIYRQVEQALYHGEPSTVSVYNIFLDGVPHVVVVGDSPPPTLEKRLMRLLAAGQATELPPEVVTTLCRRREQERSKGRWVEGHYRPGLRLPVEPEPD